MEAIKTITLETLDLNLDDFGIGTKTEDVITPSVPNALTPKENVIDTFDINKIEEETETEDKTVTNTKTDDIITAIGNEFDIVVKEVEDVTNDNTTDKVPGLVTNPLISYLISKFESKEFATTYDDFDEAKETIDQYIGRLPEKELHALLDVNVNAKIEAINEELPKEFFNSLPPELQYIGQYVENGGTDFKTLFKVLAQVEETKSFSLETEDGQEAIVRNYWQSINYGEANEIEADIKELKENGKLETKAAQFKPKLDQLTENQVKERVAQEAENKKERELARNMYIDNVKTALTATDLKGLKLDKKIAETLFYGLTRVEASPISGNPVNLLSKKLEEIQWGPKPDYALLAKLTWLANDEEGYEKALIQKGANVQAEKTTKLIKTDMANRVTSTTVNIQEDKKTFKKLPNPKNVLSR